MEVTVKKTFRGDVSVRDYLVEIALTKREDLIVLFEEDKMTIPFKDLRKGYLDPKLHYSQFDDTTYSLVDYPWIPDRDPIDNKQDKLWN